MESIAETCESVREVDITVPLILTVRKQWVREFSRIASSHIVERWR